MGMSETAEEFFEQASEDGNDTPEVDLELAKVSALISIAQTLENLEVILNTTMRGRPL